MFNTIILPPFTFSLRNSTFYICRKDLQIKDGSEQNKRGIHFTLLKKINSLRDIIKDKLTLTNKE